LALPNPTWPRPVRLVGSTLARTFFFEVLPPLLFSPFLPSSPLCVFSSLEFRDLSSFSRPAKTSFGFPPYPPCTSSFFRRLLFLPPTSMFLPFPPTIPGLFYSLFPCTPVSHQPGSGLPLGPPVPPLKIFLLGLFLLVYDKYLPVCPSRAEHFCAGGIDCPYFFFPRGHGCSPFPFVVYVFKVKGCHSAGRPPANCLSFPLIFSIPWGAEVP